MKTIISWLVANVGTSIRVITAIIVTIITLSNSSGEQTDFWILPLTILAMFFIFGSISKLLAEYPFFGALLAIAAAVGYFVFAGKIAEEISVNWFIYGIPIICAIIAIVVAIYAVKNMDDMLDFAFFINNSAVEHFSTEIGYFFNRFAETLINLLASSAVITITYLVYYTSIFI